MPLNEQSCKTCRWFKKFHNMHEFGICMVDVPFWLYKEMREQNIRRPDLNENEGTNCAAWEEKDASDH